MSALLWCMDLGLDAVLLEKNAELGGQLLQIYNPITNYLGAEAANGRDLAERFRVQLASCTDRISMGVNIVDVDTAGRSLTASGGTSYRGHALVIATGVRRRRSSRRGRLCAASPVGR